MTLSGFDPQLDLEHVEAPVVPASTVTWYIMWDPKDKTMLLIYQKVKHGEGTSTWFVAALYEDLVGDFFGEELWSSIVESINDRELTPIRLELTAIDIEPG